MLTDRDREWAARLGVPPGVVSTEPRSYRRGHPCCDHATTLPTAAFIDGWYVCPPCFEAAFVSRHPSWGIPAPLCRKHGDACSCD